MVFLELTGILKLRQGPQGASRVAPGKSNLHSSCEGELGIVLESLQGKRMSSRLVSRNPISLSSGDWDFWVAFKVHPGHQAWSLVEVKSFTGMSWSPLRGRTGVRPPVEF